MFTLNCRSGYEAGDVLGCLIKLPQHDSIGGYFCVLEFKICYFNIV